MVLWGSRRKVYNRLRFEWSQLMFLPVNQLIQIPGWEVWNTNIESDRITFLLRYLKETEVCHFCGSKHISAHKVRKVSSKRLRAFRQENYFRIRETPILL